MGARTHGSRSGFTMVELMVVAAIIGLIAGIVTVSWQAILPRETLNAEVRRLSDMIQTARSEAIARSAEYRIVYSQENSKYWLVPPFGEDGEYEPEPEKRRTLFEH
ncbi:MAG: prepilin-type N-terminal cleavage/methylation domain-containing protein, partial [Planctomycetota bacterium]